MKLQLLKDKTLVVVDFESENEKGVDVPFKAGDVLEADIIGADKKHDYIQFDNRSTLRGGVARIERKDYAVTLDVPAQSQEQQPEQ